MKIQRAAFLLMLLAVPVAGELKFYPFQDSYRVSLGTPVFFFFLLWLRKGSPALSGMAVGASVVVFRMVWDRLLHPAVWDELFPLHYPVFFYYLAYGCLFQLFKINQPPYRPLRVGALSVLTEILASLVEMSLRYSIFHETITGAAILKVIGIAVIRCFFVLGFYNILQLRQAALNEEQQRKQYEDTLLLVSDLYEEAVLLKKTLQHAEDITRDCYQLYRSLQSADAAEDTKAWAQQALRISGQIHEIKKDNQRIYAGLSKVIKDQGPSDYIHPMEIGQLIVRTNQKVAAALGKDIRFTLEVDEGLPPLHGYTVLSLMNNLAANAVEAIPDKGTIGLRLGCSGDFIELRVSDDGPGIPARNRQHIFTPGYTSKYDSSGRPSTGIGLYYVKEVVEGLQGRVELKEDAETGETVFSLYVPVRQSIVKG